MLFLLTILSVLLAVAAIAYFARRLTSSNLLEEDRSSKFIAPFHGRPLFAPTDEELRAFDREEKEADAARAIEELRANRAEHLTALESFRQAWLREPNKRHTIELLHAAVLTESGDAYSDTALAVLDSWRAGQIADLTGDDLAQLLESHFWLLPADKRSPGVTFRLNGEIADLRRASDQS